jgi:hypothetical protein
MEMYFGGLRMFIGAITTGKKGDLAPPGPGMQGFRIVTLARCLRGVNEGINKLTIFKQIAHCKRLYYHVISGECCTRRFFIFTMESFTIADFIINLLIPTIS